MQDFSMVFICTRYIIIDFVQLMKKIQRLSIPRGYGVCPILIHVNGVSDSVYVSEYFGNIIDFTALLSA